MDYNATETAFNLGLISTDYAFLMGLSGLLMGAFVCFFVLYSISNIARGR
ncbi:MAG: hypothetical protein Q8N01_06030 [Sulfuricurvum sp.]|nr:hypothetical protein [Sulfuricurvum sp.]